MEQWFLWLMSKVLNNFYDVFSGEAVPLLFFGTGI